MRICNSILVLLLLVTSSSAVDYQVIDSLKLKLTPGLLDTARVNTLLAISKEFREFNLPDSSIIYCTEALEIAESQEWEMGIATCLHYISTCYELYGDYETAILYDERGLAITKDHFHLTASDDAMAKKWILLMSSAVRRLGIFYYKVGEKNRTPEMFDQLILQCEKAGLDELTAQLRIEYGHHFVQEHWSEFNKAITLFTQALRHWEKIGNNTKIISTNLSLSSAYDKQNLYPISLKHILAALSIANEIKDSTSIVSTYHALGHLYKMMGDYKTALEYYLKRLEIIENWGERKSIAGASMSIGLAYYYLKEYQKSLEYHFRCMRICQEINEYAWYTMELNNVAIVYIKQGEFEKAIDNLLEAVEIRELHHDKDGVAWYLNALSDTYLEWSKPEMALEYYAKALKIIEEMNSTEYFIRNYLGTADAYMQLGQGAAAIKNAEKALEVAKETNQQESIMEIHFLLSEITEMTEDFERSLVHYKDYTNMKDNIFNEEKSKDLGKLEAKHEFETAEAERKQIEEERSKIELEAKSRSDNLQYSGILIFMVLVFAGVFALGKISIPIRLAEGLIFFSFLLFFEFSLVLLDPYIEEYSSGAPAIKLAFNAVLAGMIFPLHSLFETKLKGRLVK